MENDERLVGATGPATPAGPKLSSESFDHGTLASTPPLEIPNKDVSIRLIAPEHQDACSFWVGLSRKGESPPGQLLRSDSVLDLLKKAADEGLSSREPVMMSDVEDPDNPRFVYLIPEPGRGDITLWLQQVSATIRSWKPESVGFWFSPKLTGNSSPHKLLTQTLLQNILDSACREYYLLEGDYGTNSLLNAALSLRPRISESGMRLSVFH